MASITQEQVDWLKELLGAMAVGLAPIDLDGHEATAPVSHRTPAPRRWRLRHV